jgi:hypothetical protein
MNSTYGAWLSLFFIEKLRAHRVFHYNALVVIEIIFYAWI